MLWNPKVLHTLSRLPEGWGHWASGVEVQGHLSSPSLGVHGKHLVAGGKHPTWALGMGPACCQCSSGDPSVRSGLRGTASLPNWLTRLLYSFSKTDFFHSCSGRGKSLLPKPVLSRVKSSHQFTKGFGSQNLVCTRDIWELVKEEEAREPHTHPAPRFWSSQSEKGLRESAFNHMWCKENALDSTEKKKPSNLIFALLLKQWVILALWQQE